MMKSDEEEWEFTIVEGDSSKDQAQIGDGCIQCQRNKTYAGLPVPCRVQYIAEVAGHEAYHVYREGKLRRTPASEDYGPEVNDGIKAHNQGQMEVRNWIQRGYMKEGEGVNPKFRKRNTPWESTKPFMELDQGSPFGDFSEPVRTLMIEVFSW